jgi:hypothetical protein
MHYRLLVKERDQVHGHFVREKDVCEEGVNDQFFKCALGNRPRRPRVSRYVDSEEYCEDCQECHEEYGCQCGFDTD